MICFTIKLSTVIVFLRLVVGEDIQIWPKGPDYILKPESHEDNRTFMCSGNEAVKWYFEKFDKSLVAMLNYSMYFNKEDKIMTYFSFMVFNQPSYLDTGFYYCAPVSAPVEKVRNYKNIFIYVKDPTHLFADPDDLDSYDEIENGQYRIPCRPTSPDVNVTLRINDTVVSHQYHSSQKIAVTNNIKFNVVYSCEAKRNNSNDIRIRKFFIPMKNFFTINITNQGLISIGENVILNCSVKLRRNYKLKWIVQNNASIEYDKDKTFNDTHGSIILTIKNVSVEHNGNYTCELNDFTVNETYSQTFTLNMIKPNVNHLHVKILKGKHQIVRPAGFRSVHWKIQISANEKVDYVWTDPDNNIIETTPPKILVNRSNMTSNNNISYIGLTELTISDLQVYDSGVYKLIVSNKNSSIVDRVDVTLLVEEKPSVMFLKSVHKDVKYYEFGKIYTFEFFISGYPLPLSNEMKWEFKSCQNFPWCTNNETQAQIIENGTLIPTSEVTQKFKIRIKTIVSGTLSFTASNSLGNSTDQHLVFVTDVKDGFEISTESKIFAGDNTTFACCVSKHYYVKPISCIVQNVNTVMVHQENETEFTICSFYTIPKISFSYNKRILSCNVTRKAQTNNETEDVDTKTFEIIVRDPYVAYIQSPSNMKIHFSPYKAVHLNCIADGGPLPTISWLKDDIQLKTDNQKVVIEEETINDGIKSNLFIKSPKINDEGIYKCVATNRLKSAMSDYELIYYENDEEILFSYFVAVLLGFLGMGCTLCYLKEKNLKMHLKKSNRIRFDKGMVDSWNPDLDILDQTDLLPYDERWEFPKDKLKIGKKLGSGAFGVVSKGYAEGITDIEPITTVAIKTVKPYADKMYVNALKSELKILCHIGNHVNVVNLLGACTANIRLMVIVEYCRFGNIQQYLLKHRDLFINQIRSDGSLDYTIQTISKPSYENWSNTNHSSKNRKTNNARIDSDDDFNIEENEPEWRYNYFGDYTAISIKPFTTNDLICWAFQVARGMEYLARKKILHGDLAARNILLAEENIIKICDFGLAKSMYNKEYYRKKGDKGLLPYKWMSIEAIKDRIFSSQSDVWSFGIVLWEIFSLAATPYPNIEFNDFLFKLLEGYRMEMPQYANTQLYKIMKSCWNADPDRRPLFTELVDRLGDFLEKDKIKHYIDLNEYYEQLNAKRSPMIDYMKLMTKRRESSSSLEFEDHTEWKHSNKKQYVNKNEIEMLPIVHNPGYEIDS